MLPCITAMWSRHSKPAVNQPSLANLRSAQLNSACEQLPAAAFQAGLVTSFNDHSGLS